MICITGGISQAQRSGRERQSGDDGRDGRDEREREFDVERTAEEFGTVDQDRYQLVHALAVLAMFLFQSEPGRDVVLDRVLMGVETKTD